MKKIFGPACALLCLIFAVQAFCQSSNSTLGGTATDPSGALVPGVTITATNTQTGVMTTVITNESGTYYFASLQPGVYRVAATLPGFQTLTYDNFELGSTEQKRLNFPLKLATAVSQVEVTVDASQMIAISSSSVGQVLPEYKVRDLPLPNRDVLDLIGIMPGVSGEGATASFAGGRTNSINTTLDGLNTSSFRYENGVYSTARISPDLVSELRIILAPADAETGRGSGQVQILTRSGTNKFGGSAVWNVVNSAFNANTWQANAATPRTVPNWSNRHQGTVTYGGPIVRNKTFFFTAVDVQRSYSRTNQAPLVLTDDARAGFFRYFPGVNNANANANVTGSGNTLTAPVVDYAGNPLKPSQATGDLQRISVFGRDPNRPGFDTTGWIQKLIKDMPHANAFDSGDGLNTAAFRWVRRTKGTDAFNAASDTTNRNQLNLKIDQNFNQAHKLSVNWNWEHDFSQQTQSAWPNGFNGEVLRTTHLLTTSLTSTLSSSVVNEFRFGMNRLSNHNFAEYMNSKTGDDALAYLPQINGIPVMVHPTSFNTHMLQVGTADSNGANTPIINWTYADSLSWVRGKHAFKGGIEFRFFRTTGFNSERILPHAIGGAGNAAVPSLAAAGPGLLANNETTMRNLLLTLSGSIASIQEAFTLNNPEDTEFKDYKELKAAYERPVKYRQYLTNEMSYFFKDDWKVRPSFTVNAGLRWEYYGVPYEGHGLMAAPIGDGIVAFGYSGRSFADWKTFGPQKADLTTVQFVGPNSPNPDKSLYQRDLNNFSPNMGFSWTLPWFGKDKTVLRAGYGIAYQGGGRALSIDQANSLPGLNQFATYTTAGFMDLSNIPIPVPNRNKPLQASPVTERTQLFDTWDPNLVSPYVQNFNASITRTLSRFVTLDVRYVGTKGTKLLGVIPINEVNIYNNGILDAFLAIRNGGDSPLINQIFRGLNLGAGVTPSAYLRSNTNWRGFFANGSVGGFANRLNTSTEITGVAGGLLRNGGLPENFIASNPQFATVNLRSNPSTSAYHSLQTVITLRPTHGISYQGTYVWSKGLAIGTGDTFDDWRDATNRSLDKELQGSHRSHDFRSNGTFELPFGPNKLLLGNSSGILARLVERWQASVIVNLTSGAPLNLTTGATTNLVANTPNIVGDFPRQGTAKKVSNLAVYFEGYTFPDDPQCATITTAQAVNAQCTNNAIMGPDGKLVLVNPQPGKLGTLGRRWIEGPGTFRFDTAASKRVRVGEGKELQLRIDAQNVLNHPLLGNPTLDINSANFGRITTASGARTFSASARVSF